MKHQSYKSYTHLHLATVKMQPSVIEGLVDCGVDMNLTEDENGNTALHLAMENLTRSRGCELINGLQKKLLRIDKAWLVKKDS